MSNASSNQSDASRPKLVRPAKCHFCDKPLFYAGDPRHEPEVHVIVEARNETIDHGFYAHVRCWNARVARKFDSTTGSIIPADELASLRSAWLKHASKCDGDLKLALESCAMDLDRLRDAYSPNDGALCDGDEPPQTLKSKQS